MQDVSRECVVAAEARRMNCPYCKSSRTNFNGRRKARQIYLCRGCGKQWRKGGAVGGRSYPPDQIGDAIQMYYGGFSLRKVANALKERFDIQYDVSPETIRNWVETYTDVAIILTRDLKPPGGEAVWAFCIWTDSNTRQWWQIVFDHRTSYICGNDVGGVEEDYQASEIVSVVSESATIPYKEIRYVTQWMPDLRSALCYPEHRVRYRYIKRNGDKWVAHVEGNSDFPPGLGLPPSFQEYKAACVRFEKIKDTGKIGQRLAGWMITRNWFTTQTELRGSTPGEAAGIKSPIASWADVVRLEARAFLPTVDPKAPVATRHPSKEPASEGDCGSQG